jgi:putative transposase
LKTALSELTPELSMKTAYDALGVPRSTAYRWLQPSVHGPRCQRPPSPRALGAGERKEVLDLLYSKRFIDQAPATVHAKLLDEDRRYLCHPRTMYRILAGERATRERRAQVRHPEYTKPELLATGPNQVWTWDVTWLRGPVKYTYYPLYVIIDLFSRFNPGWLLAHQENGDLAVKLIHDTCRRQGIDPGTLKLHADRGSVPKGKTVNQLLVDLDVTPSFSRPRVSNDNPFSEAEFRTMKYGPEYPDRFEGYEDAREFCRRFFPWYNNEHRHSGIAYFPPADVHNGRVPDVLARRQTVMDEAHARTPERFPAGAPTVPAPPKAVWINPPENRDEIELGLH